MCVGGGGGGKGGLSFSVNFTFNRKMIMVRVT